MTLLLAGCAHRPGFVEHRLQPWRVSPDGDRYEVEGKILAVHDYSDNAGRTDSLATFPHIHLEVVRTKGTIPRHPELKVFDCHLSIDPTRSLAVGDTIHLLFDPSGELDGPLIVLKGKTQEASNNTSEGIRQPADGLPKPSM